MSRYKKDSIEYKMKAELSTRFCEQERITVQDAIEEYYEPNSPYSFLTARMKMNSIINSIKISFLKEGIPFGCLNDLGEFGIPAIKEEYEYLGIQRYKMWKGIVRNAAIIATSGVKKGLLKYRSETETMRVPLLKRLKKKNK